MADGPVTCIKCLLIFFDILIGLIGVAFLAVGAILQWVSNMINLRAFMEAIPEELRTGTAKLLVNVTVAVPYIFLAFGGLLFVLSILGCIGACKQNRCVLGVYLVPLGLLFLAALALGLLVVFAKHQASFQHIRNVKKQELEEEKLIQKDTGGIVVYTAIGEQWQTMQSKDHCCGSAGPSDYRNNPSLNKTALLLPSCCVMKEGRQDDPTMENAASWATCYADSLKPQPESGSSFLYTQGCYSEQKLKPINDGLLYTLAILFGFAGLELLCFILGLVLCCMGRREDDESKVV